MNWMGGSRSRVHNYNKSEESRQRSFFKTQDYDGADEVAQHHDDEEALYCEKNTECSKKRKTSFLNPQTSNEYDHLNMQPFRYPEQDYSAGHSLPSKSFSGIAQETIQRNYLPTIYECESQTDSAGLCIFRERGDGEVRLRGALSARSRNTKPYDRTVSRKASSLPANNTAYGQIANPNRRRLTSFSPEERANLPLDGMESAKDFSNWKPAQTVTQIIDEDDQTSVSPMQFLRQQELSAPPVPVRFSDHAFMVPYSRDRHNGNPVAILPLEQDAFEERANATALKPFCFPQSSETHQAIDDLLPQRITPNIRRPIKFINSQPEHEVFLQSKLQEHHENENPISTLLYQNENLDNYNLSSLTTVATPRPSPIVGSVKGSETLLHFPHSQDHDWLRQHLEAQQRTVLNQQNIIAAQLEQQARESHFNQKFQWSVYQALGNIALPTIQAASVSSAKQQQDIFCLGPRGESKFNESSSFEDKDKSVLQMRELRTADTANYQYKYAYLDK